MKLIIEIPDEEYKDIKDNPSVWSRHFQTIIANGIPYEALPKNDWIPIKNAEELPKDKMLWVTDAYGRVSELYYDMTEWSGYVRVDDVVAYRYKDKDPEAYDGPICEP